MNRSTSPCTASITVPLSMRADIENAARSADDRFGFGSDGHMADFPPKEFDATAAAHA